MANFVWIGGDSGNENDFNTAANWLNGSVPSGSNAVLYFDSRAGDDATAGTKYACDGYDASALTDCVLIIGDDYDANIGGNDSGDLPLSLNAIKIIHRGSGEVHVELKDAADHDCPLVVLDGSGALYLSSYNNTETIRNTFQRIINVNGTLDIADDTSILEIINVTSSASTTIGSGCYQLEGTDTFAEIIHKAGSMITDSKWEKLIAIAGTIQVGDAAVAAFVTQNIINLGATINYQPNNSSGTPELNDAIIAAGSLNCLSENDFTVGSGSGEDIILVSTGILDVSDNLSDISFASGSVVSVLGGTLSGNLEDVTW